MIPPLQPIIISVKIATRVFPPISVGSAPAINTILMVAHLIVFVG